MIKRKKKVKEKIRERERFSAKPYVNNPGIYGGNVAGWMQNDMR